MLKLFLAFAPAAVLWVWLRRLQRAPVDPHPFTAFFFLGLAVVVPTFALGRWVTWPAPWVRDAAMAACEVALSAVVLGGWVVRRRLKLAPDRVVAAALALGLGLAVFKAMVLLVPVPAKNFDLMWRAGVPAMLVVPLQAAQAVALGLMTAWSLERQRGMLPGLLAGAMLAGASQMLLAAGLRAAGRWLGRDISMDVDPVGAAVALLGLAALGLAVCLLPSALVWRRLAPWSRR